MITMKISRRKALPLMASGILAPGYLLSSCGSSGISRIDRSINLPGSITFTSNRGGFWNIIVSDFNSEFPRKLTGDLGGDHKQACYSADGQKVYFASKPGGSWNIAVINDLTDPVGSYEVLVEEAGDQTFPILTPDGSKLIYLNEEAGQIKPDIYSYDLTGGTIEEIATGLNVKSMEFRPGTNTLFVIDGTLIKMVNIETGVVTQYMFGSEGGNAFQHSTFTFSGDGSMAYCSGLFLNALNYSLATWNIDNPQTITELLDVTGNAVNLWNELKWAEIDGDPYLLVSGKTDISAYQLKIGILDIRQASWTTRFMRGMQGDNVDPTWTLTEHF